MILSKTDIARILRPISGAARFDDSDYLKARAIEAATIAAYEAKLREQNLAQAAQIEMLCNALTECSGRLDSDDSFERAAIERAYKATVAITPSQALDQFAAKVREQGPVDVTVEQAEKPNHLSFVPFKCPACGSSYFGPIFAGGEHVGRYCKGWPSGCDRSYNPCRGKHEEMFVTPNALGQEPCAAVCARSG